MNRNTVTVTNLKLAAALSAVGAKLDSPFITRVASEGKQQVVSLHFSPKLDSGESVMRLIQAYHHGTREKSGPAYLMSILRASLDNRERLVDAVKSKLIETPEKCAQIIDDAVKRAPLFLHLKVGDAHVLVPSNASPEYIRKLVAHGN